MIDHVASSVFSEWKLDSIYQEYPNGRITLVDGGGSTVDRKQIERRVKGWTPFSGFLIGGDSSRLLPAICSPNMAQIARKSYMKKYGLAVALWLFGACFVSIASLLGSKDFGVSMTATIAAVYFIVDYMILLKPFALEERARYIYWVKNNRRIRLAFTIALIFALMVGAFQWTLIRLEGTKNQVISKFGLVFKSVLDGDWWRLVSGPYLHANLLHYLSNIALFAPFFALSYIYLGRRAIYLFVLSNLLIPMLSAPWIADQFQAYAGISAGIFSLLGGLFLLAASNKNSFPKGFASNILLLSFLVLASSYVMNKNSLLISHVLGFIFGVGFVAVVHRKRS